MNSEYSSDHEVEELSKKSFEVILPLDKNRSNPDVKDSKEDSDGLSSDQDEGGRPSCNMWNGKHHQLHVLGNYENDFQKHLKSFRVPLTIPVEYDPHCRASKGFLAGNSNGEFPIGEAFILWQANNQIKSLNETKKLTKSEEEVVKDGSMNNMTDTSSESEDEHVSFNLKEFNCSLEDIESDVEQEIFQYIKIQKKKKKQGTNITGESLWYDGENETIRNLHKDSISLTSYGKMGDQHNFGKTHLLFDQLTLEEQHMLQHVEAEGPEGIHPESDITADLTKEQCKKIACKVSISGGGDCIN